MAMIIVIQFIVLLENKVPPFMYNLNLSGEKIHGH